MEKIDNNEIEKISKEYKYVQVKVSPEALERLDGLSSAIPSRSDRAMPEIYVDLNDYCDLGDSDVLVDIVQERNKNIDLIVFYA